MGETTQEFMQNVSQLGELAVTVIYTIIAQWCAQQLLQPCCGYQLEFSLDLWFLAI